MTMWQRQYFIAIGMIVVSTLSSSLSMASTSQAVNPDDPYESFNRVMYNFNDFIDKAILKPVATAYNKVIPKPVVKGIGNIFNNIDTIPTVINDVLQANFYQASSDTWRFAINTTVGIGGFFEVADKMGLERNSEDLGLTLAQWGWKNSNYLVLPFLGPTTVRDGLAWPVNYEFFTIYPYIHPLGVRYSIYSLYIISKRAEALRFQDVIEQASLDRYVFMRDAYMQHRRYKIERNKQLGDPYINKNTLENPT
jgi:phospholipid-binding lipoprotein MlaA